MARKIHLVAGARPNFMKIAPLYHVLSRTDWAEPVVIHTGQHHDPLMSDIFWDDLGLPAPHVNLGVGSGSHAETTAAVMVAYEKICRAAPPDWVIVVGDVNSTVAAALTAKKLNLPVAHLEAGLRSFDRTMPEEINRIVTDSISDLLWTPSDDADRNLEREGVTQERIVRIGNVMIDAFEMLAPKIRAADTLSRFGLTRAGYGVVTLHRPSNVDDPKKLRGLMSELSEVSRLRPLIFPVHPRTRKALAAIGSRGAVTLVDPMGYIQFMNLVENSSLVITDSGGIQEETTYLGIPCLTVRPTTERPITLTLGTNRLVRSGQIVAAVDTVLGDRRRVRPRIPLWDGHAAERAAASLKQFCRA